MESKDPEWLSHWEETEIPGHFKNGRWWNKLKCLYCPNIQLHNKTKCMVHVSKHHPEKFPNVKCEAESSPRNQFDQINHGLNQPKMCQKSFNRKLELKVQEELRILYGFLKSNKNKGFRKPFQDIVNSVNKIKLTKIDQQIKSGLYGILEIFASKGQCGKCGHRNYQLDLTPAAKPSENPKQREAVEAFQDYCDRSLDPVITMPRVPFDESIVWKPNIDLPFREFKLRVKRQKKPKQDSQHDLDQVFGEEVIPAFDSGDDSDEYCPSGGVPSVDSMSGEELAGKKVKTEYRPKKKRIRRRNHTSKRKWPENHVEDDPIVEVINGDLPVTKAEGPIISGDQEGQNENQEAEPNQRQMTETEIHALKFVKKNDSLLKKEDFDKFFKVETVGGKCPKCCQDFETKTKLLYHQPCRYKSISQNPVCPICSRSFAKKYLADLFSHMESVHFHSRKYKCLICIEKEFVIFNQQSMVTHVIRKHINSFAYNCSWPGCNKGFNSKGQCLYHVMTFHLKRRNDIKKKRIAHRNFFKFECPIERCPTIHLLTIDRLKNHLKKQHPVSCADLDNLVKISIERREAKRRKRLRKNSQTQVKVDLNTEEGTTKIIVEHPDIKLPEKVVRDVPKIEYESIEDLQKKAAQYIHLEKSQPHSEICNLFKFSPVQESCPYKTCSSTFDQKSKAIAHASCQSYIRKDPASDQVMCEMCHQTYSSRGTLKSHLDFHFPKQYSCLLCRKEYYDDHSVIKHINEVHYSNKKFACKMENCGKSLSTMRSALNHVISVHFKTFPFQCPFCKVAKVTEIELKIHLSRSHPKPEEMIYPCFEKECPLKFPSVMVRNRHISAKHKNFVWTEEHKKQNQIDRKNVQGKGELINGQLVMIEAAGIRKGHENVREKPDRGKRISLVSILPSYEGQGGSRFNKWRSQKKSPVKRSRKRTKKDSSSDEDSDESETNQPTGLKVLRPQFLSNQSVQKAINQPSTSGQHSTTTVEAVIEPADYWYQNQPFSTTYVSMPNVIPQAEAGKISLAMNIIVDFLYFRTSSIRVFALRLH